MTTSDMAGTEKLDSQVAAAYDSYGEDVRLGLLEMRRLILETAEETQGVGPIEESIKWGQPAYRTVETGSGSTIRLAPAGRDSGYDYAMYFICSTNLIGQFEDLFGDTFTYDGERALLFKIGEPWPTDELRECVAMALTYHQRM